MTLLSNPDIFVLDSTKLHDFRECPRKFFYTHVLGWTKPSYHLRVGAIWHKAMELVWNGHFSDDARDAALDALVRLWDEEFSDTPREVLVLMSPKTLPNLLRALAIYVEQYRGRVEYEVLFTETGGTISLGGGRTLAFKMDAIVNTPDGITAYDFKTSGYVLGTAWAQQWTLSYQVSAYLTVLHCLFGEANRINGIVIDGVCFRNPPRTKKDGGVYANDKDIEFMRVPVRRTAEALSSWVVNVRRWYDAVFNEFELLQATNLEEDQALKAFPYDDTGCGNWGGCPYFMLCCARHNPLHHIDDMPQGFTKRIWNPLTEINEHNQIMIEVK